MSILHTFFVAFQMQVYYHFLPLLIYLQWVHLTSFSAKDLVTPSFQGWHQYTLRLLLFPTGQAFSLVCDPVLCASSFNPLLLLQSLRLSSVSSVWFSIFTFLLRIYMFVSLADVSILWIFVSISVKQTSFLKCPLKLHQQSSSIPVISLLVLMLFPFLKPSYDSLTFLECFIQNIFFFLSGIVSIGYNILDCIHHIG